MEGGGLGDIVMLGKHKVHMQEGNLCELVEHKVHMQEGNFCESVESKIFMEKNFHEILTGAAKRCHTPKFCGENFRE